MSLITVAWYLSIPKIHFPVPISYVYVVTINSTCIYDFLLYVCQNTNQSFYVIVILKNIITWVSFLDNLAVWHLRVWLRLVLIKISSSSGLVATENTLHTLLVGVVKMVVTPDQCNGPVGGYGVRMCFLPQILPVFLLRNKERVQRGRRDGEPRRRYGAEVVWRGACLRPVWWLTGHQGFLGAGVYLPVLDIPGSESQEELHDLLVLFPWHAR